MEENGIYQLLTLWHDVIIYRVCAWDPYNKVTPPQPHNICILYPWAQVVHWFDTRRRKLDVLCICLELFSIICNRIFKPAVSLGFLQSRHVGSSGDQQKLHVHHPRCCSALSGTWKDTRLTAWWTHMMPHVMGSCALLQSVFIAQICAGLRNRSQVLSPWFSMAPFTVVPL